MRHAKKRNTLGRAKDQTKALLRSLAASLFTHGQIQTTLTKAKVLRPFVEKIITMGRKALSSTEASEQLHYKRLIASRLSPSHISVVLEAGAKHQMRNGGYTRIVKLGRRAGDNTEMAVIEILQS